MALYIESLLNPSKNKEEEKEEEETYRNFYVLVFLSQSSFSYAIRVISLKGQSPRFISMVHKIP